MEQQLYHQLHDTQGRTEIHGPFNHITILCSQIRLTS